MRRFSTITFKRNTIIKCDCPIFDLWILETATDWFIVFFYYLKIFWENIELLFHSKKTIKLWPQSHDFRNLTLNLATCWIHEILYSIYIHGNKNKKSVDPFFCHGSASRICILRLPIGNRGRGFLCFRRILNRNL